MSDTPVRVRIAPSPTGYLHVGTARTALFNYLFARHYGGQFVVRIEDTDLERSKAELIQPILDALTWLGLSWDEEPVYQSKRLDRYSEYAAKLLETGHGYRCFCTKEELEAARKKAKEAKGPLKYPGTCRNLSDEEIKAKLEAGVAYTIRLKIPEGDTTFEDMVSGPITRHSDDIEDLIVARADGSATYNLAVVIDDHEMGITHVIRGNDHVTNTFKQVHVYRAFGWAVPQFGHVPLILRPDKKKVSKRLGDKDVAEYREEGIVPSAMFNYLCLLGWSPKTDREIYTPSELIDIFSEKGFNASNAVFDEEKLVAFNKAHIAQMSDHGLATLVAPMIVDAGYSTKYWLETRWEYLRAVVGLLKERVRRVSDFVEMSRYFFEFDYTYDPDADKKHFKPEAAERLTKLADRFAALDEFTHDDAEQALGSLAEELGVGKGKLIHPTRLAVSGMPVGPGLYDLLVTLGRDHVIARMRKAVEYINAKPTA